MARRFALTTTNNPWNPLTHFDEWYVFDEVVFGYHTCSYLARIACTSSAMSESAYDSRVESAMDEIVAFDLLGKETNGAVHYRKVEM